MYHAHIVNALYHDHFFSHFIFCHVSYIFNQYYVSCDCYQCYVSAQIILTVFISKLHIQDGDAHQSHQDLNEHIMDILFILIDVIYHAHLVKTMYHVSIITVTYQHKLY